MDFKVMIIELLRYQNCDKLDRNYYEELKIFITILTRVEMRMDGYLD